MARVFNFSAGPAMLPEAVLRQAAEEMVDYHGVGMSVMEMSHRSKVYESIHNEAIALLRELMNIPDEYEVLFLQGGATTQFAMVPLNLFGPNKKAGYISTGSWSQKAIKEAKKYGQVEVLASSKEANFSYIPKFDDYADRKLDYIHITSNNTIFGTKISTLPKTGSIPLVSDMSSYILSEDFSVGDYGLVYAGAQKNIGPSGVTVVIVRKDLIGKAAAITPTYLDYAIHAKDNSLYNTPPCYSIYIAKLVFGWLKNLGGIAAMERINRQKAALLYEYLDRSKLFKATIEKGDDRSLMTIPFVTGNEEIDSAFIKAAEKEGLVTLKGHRSVGGMRASIYNAMPLEGVKKLVSFMGEFESANIRPL